MTLSEIDLARITKHVGGLCERRNRPDLRDQLSLEYRIERHDVTIFERRARWDGSPGHTDSGVAKLKLVRGAAEWRLYWQRADMRWHAYPPLPSSRDLAELVEEIDKDPNGCFFG